LVSLKYYYALRKWKTNIFFKSIGWATCLLKKATATTKSHAMHFVIFSLFHPSFLCDSAIIIYNKKEKTRVLFRRL
jgi:hypothetical protein